VKQIKKAFIPLRDKSSCFCGTTQIDVQYAHSFMHTIICILLITGRTPVSAYSPMISGFPRKSIHNGPVTAFPSPAAFWIQEITATRLAPRFGQIVSYLNVSRI